MSETSSEMPPPDSDIDLGTDEGLPAQAPLQFLEDKYREQMRQINPVRIDLPMFTLATQIKEQIELKPDFQRRDRWNDEKRSRLIESIIMNVPIPPVFLGEEEYGKYEVLDGRQRLTAAYRFLTDQLQLEGLKVWKELNGSTYSDLKRKGFGATVDRRFLSAVLLTRESSPEVKYEVFDRLNTGGVKANPMEVRNAVFPGPFKDALHEFSRDATFRTLWGIPTSGNNDELERNSLYRDMSDIELVLRFFALRKATLEGSRYSDHLTETMTTRNKEYKASPRKKDEDAALFAQAINNVFNVFGEGAFRPPNSERRTFRSAPYADALMQAMADVDPAIALDARTAQRIRDEIAKLGSVSDFRAAISSGTNGETAIKNRISLARTAVKSAIGA